MQNQLVGPSNEVKQILDMFSESTGDYYLFYDFRKDQIHFSSNIQNAEDLFALNRTTCTLTEWRQSVDAHDLHRLVKVMSELTGGITDHYNFNYRVKNAKGQSNWINSRGKAYSGPGRPPCLCFGPGIPGRIVPLGQFIQQPGIEKGGP